MTFLDGYFYSLVFIMGFTFYSVMSSEENVRDPSVTLNIPWKTGFSSNIIPQTWNIILAEKG